MQSSQLQIKRIEYTKLSIEALATEVGENQSLDNCIVEIFRNQEITNIWMVTLTLSFGSTRQNVRYAGEVSLLGEFETAKTLNEITAEDLVNVNGPSVLYSSAREIILMVTSRCPKGPWMLPSVTFIDRRKPQPATVNENKKDTSP